MYGVSTGSPMRCCVVIIRNMYIITTSLATSEWIFIRTKYIHKLTRKNIPQYYSNTENWKKN